MDDFDSALDDIARIRAQLAASTRFRGLAPGVVAATGVLAVLTAGWQTVAGREGLLIWIMLAAVCALLIGTEAVIRAQRLHRLMADRLLTATLNRFMPVATAGAIIGVIVITQVPEHTRLLPGVWQLLMGVGIFAVLGNLPKQMTWAAVFYFAAGTVSLMLSGEHGMPLAWLMGTAFGGGQILVAAILYRASKETSDG